jgi:ubiquinone/menaquinone biosynthesis C-methylase UbiE
VPARESATSAGSIKLRRPLTDLGQFDASLASILSPIYEQSDIDRHVHALFQENYQEFLRPFPLTREFIDHWLDLFRAYMPRSHDGEAPSTILDLGSGGGTSVFPLVEMFPGAEIFASDLSVNLLRELRQWHHDHYPSHDRLSLLQLNAEDTVFADGQFDLVTGAHVLHHLHDLRKAFTEIGRILRPGGVALFFEPFESGCQLLSLIMQLLIATNQSVPVASRIPEDVVAGFRVFMHDIWRRKGVAKSQELLDRLDDKWVFTETQLRHAIAGTGIELIAIKQVYQPAGLVSQMVDHELRRRLHSLAVLPEWAQQMVADVEGQFSHELIAETLFSGAIQLRKDARDSTAR